MEKFSYSKLSTYESCGWRYKLTYIDKHFINDKSVATDFGSLVHFIEESIAKDILEVGDASFMFDIEKYQSYFKDYNKDGIIGIKQLKEKYPEDFYKADKNGLTYEDKANKYLKTGIYRLKNYLDKNPDIEIIAAEKEFNLDFNGYIFHGFIDRLLRDKSTGEYIIEDIKTYSAPLEEKDLTTPLQFVFYTMAVKEMYNTDNISCFYEIPICDIKQSAGTKGYLNRGIKKIEKLLSEIEAKEFIPSASPLCHWCIFSETYPNQPEEAKNLCPYYSHWTRENKDFSVENDWMGIDNHEAILESFINNHKNKNISKNIEIKKIIELPISSERRFLIRG